MSSSDASSSKGQRKFNEVKKPSVLIVASDDISQNSYILCLKKFIVETLQIRNGFIAFNSHDKTQMCFDLILMSSNMPIMDGIKMTMKNISKYLWKPLTKEILQSLIEKISNKF
ncbi:hypothetical protein H5410_058497 [Solanum commersonii]|uniref:Response regulatory domain-containing protein n=1 Tax=Solanum commersonii TaxID=4109 RepID=A0A9J5WQZ4_SOLCO|nr:hypothetical protein H5410_058497 [Solanum commersonii]